MIASLGILLASFLVFASPALFRKQTRGWVIVLMLVVVGDLIASIVGGAVQQTLFGHALHWQWLGKGFSFVFGLIVAIILVASGKFRARELGLSFLQAPGTGRALLTVVLPSLVLLVVVHATVFTHIKDRDLETLAFQATMPGLTEELTFRGIILALFDRMFAGRFRVLGAELGYGAIATTLIFGLGHIVAFDGNIAHLDITNAIYATAVAFFLAWMRYRSRSLVLPVVLHNLSNIMGHIVPKVMI